MGTRQMRGFFRVRLKMTSESECNDGDSDSSSQNDDLCPPKQGLDGAPGKVAWLFFAEDFQGFLAEDAVAGNPSG
jgi:hypothetical protein